MNEIERQKRASFQAFLAGLLIGSTVQDRQGKTIGVVQNLVFDQEKEILRYVLVAVDSASKANPHLIAISGELFDPAGMTESGWRHSNAPAKRKVPDAASQHWPDFTRSSSPLSGRTVYWNSEHWDIAQQQNEVRRTIGCIHRRSHRAAMRVNRRRQGAGGRAE